MRRITSMSKYQLGLNDDKVCYINNYENRARLALTKDQSINHYSPYSVTFTPFLTAPNPQAMPIQVATAPNNSPSSTCMEVIAGISTMIAVAVVTALLGYSKKRKHQAASFSKKAGT